MTSANSLNFLSEANSLYQFNTFEIKWLESYRCEDIPIIIEEDEDSDFVPQTDETESETESFELSEDTAWMILGVIVIIILIYYFLNTGGDE